MCGNESAKKEKEGQSHLRKGIALASARFAFNFVNLGARKRLIASAEA
jgi:hypothetical protein